ncbi:MAG: FHA domain-containing protein [Nitrospirae bacterium]|nr:FHA domain-containing protein [Nitrospirota bacterium]
MARLVVIKGPNTGDIHFITLLSQKVGRLPSNDIVLEDRLASRNHAELERRGKDFFITDLDSYNGTFVNGTKIKEKKLNDKDEITIGKTTFRFEEEVADILVLDDSQPFVPPEGTIIKPVTDSFIAKSLHGLTPLPASPDAKKPPTFILDPHELQLDKKESAGEGKNFFFILYEIGRALLSTIELNHLLNLIVDLVLQVIKAERAFLLLLDKEKGELIPHVVRHSGLKPEEGGNITISKTIAKQVIKEKVSILTSDAKIDPRFKGGESIILYGIRSAMCVPLWNMDDVLGIIYVDSLISSNRFSNDDLELLTAIANQAAIGIQQARLKEKILKEAEFRKRLSQYHSPDIVDLIMKEIQEGISTSLDVQEKEVTILFSDIQGFTSISEKLSPADVANLLNDYFSLMTDIIFKHGGTLDKYIGDAIMAIFGAPFSHKDDAVRAVRAAVEMRKELNNLMSRKDTAIKFNIRIGINTGDVVAGNIGSLQRMEYTVLGDAVNTAARLETMSKPGQILIGEQTYKLTKDFFEIKPVGKWKVKGKEKEVMVYEVVG